MRVREAFPRHPFLRFDLIVSWISSSRLRAANMETSMLKRKKKKSPRVQRLAPSATLSIGVGCGCGGVVLSFSISLKEDLPQPIGQEGMMSWLRSIRPDVISAKVISLICRSSLRGESWWYRREDYVSHSPLLSSSPTPPPPLFRLFTGHVRR